MSTAAFSPFIPDLDLITYYAENRDSALTRASPWTKGCLVFFSIIAITITRNIPVLAGLYLLLLILYLVSHLPVKKLLSWYTLPIFFVVSLVGILMWSEPGSVLFTLSAGGLALSLTDNGLILVATLILKAVISVTSTLLFLMTTRYQYLAGIVSRIFPSPLDQIFLLTYRFLFLTLAMTASVLKAVRSRGGGLARSLRMQGGLFAGVFALVFIRSFERGERVHKAMTARGFTGTYPLSADVPRPAAAGYAGILVMGTLAALTALLPPGGW